MRFSIVLPVRNGGHYVKECVSSILAQTISDFNLLVLDNCSTDGTLEWLQSIDDRRIIIHPSEKPLSIEDNWARIRHLDKAEFMTMIGHDDILQPHYLSEMGKLINKFPHASLYQTHYDYVDKDGKVTRRCLPMDEVQQAHEFLACQMCSTIDSTGTGYMMRSADFDAIGGMPVKYPNLIFADYELWVRLGMKSFKATSLRNCFSYREHLSVSRLTDGMVYYSAFDLYIKFVATLKDVNVHFDSVISRYGKTMLLSFCESLSHRLLKTPVSKRKFKVSDLIRAFRDYAKSIIPGEVFEPETVPRIKYALLLDRNAIGRSIFSVYRSFVGR